MIFTIKETDTQSGSLIRTKPAAPLMAKISLFAQSCIQKNIVRGVKPANAALTQAVKQGNQTLRDTGGLLASINSRSNASEAAVYSSHIAAAVNHPDDGRTEIVIKPKRAKSLTIPAGSYTRTLQRRYGFSPREVLDGLRSAGYSVYIPRKRGTQTRSNVIMAVLSKGNTLKSGKASTAKKFQPFAVFFLVKQVRVPVRRFMYLDEKSLQQVDQMAEDYYAGT